MVEKYLKCLLHEHDCVVIPEFGGFITNYVSAEIHPIRHTFLPASKTVAFNEKLKVNDNILAEAIASGENISLQEANKLIKMYVLDLKKVIKEKNKYIFDEVGSLFINHEYRLQFEPVNKVNFNDDSYGLPELYCKPISRDNNRRLITEGKDRGPIKKEASKLESKNNVNKQIKRKFSIWPIFVFPLIVLVCLAGYVFIYRMDSISETSNMNPFALFSEPAVATNTKELPSTDEMEQELLGTVNEEIIPVDTKSQINIESASLEKSVTSKSSDKVNTIETKETSSETKPVTIKEDKKESIAPAKEPVVVNKVEKTKPDIVAEPLQASNTNLKTSEDIKGISSDKSSSETLIVAANKYHIISGGFSTKENAIKLRKKLKKNGYSSRIIDPATPTGNYKVTIGPDFDKLDEAKIQLEKLKAENNNNDLWIFKY